MEMDAETLRRAPKAQSNPAFSPMISTYPQTDPSRISTVFFFSALRAFADGFSGGILAGLLYCIALSYFYPAGLDRAWMRVLAISLTFGGFETWRVMRRRTLGSVRTCLIGTLALCLLLLWGIDAVATLRIRRLPPPRTPEGEVVFATGHPLTGDISSTDPPPSHWACLAWKTPRFVTRKSSQSAGWAGKLPTY